MLLVLIGGSSYSIYRTNQDPCDRPLRYSIGQFDTQFGISEEQFKKYAARSEEVWEKALGREVFVYDPEADFKINLIYDERQILTDQKQKTEFGLLSVEEAFKILDSRFNTFKAQYDRAAATYEAALAAFEKRKSAYDAEVQNWNRRGGAPKEKYEDLEAERKYLNAEADRINGLALSLNSSASELNLLLEDRNKKAADYNKVAESYNEKYNRGLEFNQAEYVGNPRTHDGLINVYQFGNEKDLVTALTHEFGHALSLEHVDNQKSVMYFLTGANTQTIPILTGEDLAELDRVCGS